MAELQHLVRAVAGGGAAPPDRLAAERELCVQLAPRIRLYGLRHLGDETAAADLVQEALAVLLQAAREGRIEEPAHVDRFVLGTCRNLVARSRRNERRAESFESAVLPLSEAEMPPAFSRLDAARLALCLGTIAAREQRVIVMTFQDDLSADEIGNALGISSGNVRVLRHRAMAALQSCVEGSGA